MAERISRFSNSGLHAAETLFVAAHPRAEQYLDQAPILVMWAHPWALWGDAAGQVFARTVIAGHCEKGIRLKDFLRECGYTAPMREIAGSVLLPSRAPLYRMLARIDPAVLGQSLPTTAKAQRAWLSALNAWVSRWKHKAILPDHFDDLFVWAVTRFEGAQHNAADLVDFQQAAPFNLDWGLKRAAEEMENWHRRITLDSQIRTLPVKPDQPIDLGPHKDRSDLCGLVFTALRTPREIADEGSAMRHCVATYIRSVFDGNSHIVSVTKDDRRVATLELAGPRSNQKWAVRQLRGPRNSPVSPVIESGCRLYSELQREIARKGPNLPAKTGGR